MNGRIAIDQLKDPVYIRYLDHVLFKYSKPLWHGPVEREAVGWLIKQNEKAVWIVTDRSTTALEHQVIDDSGLIILTSDILEMKRLDQGTQVKYRPPHRNSCRVGASGKGSVKLGPAQKAGGKLPCKH